METTAKLHPGQKFEALKFSCLDGADYTIGAPGDWQALFIFPGQHCPICKSYLGEIEQRREAFVQLGVSVAAASADNEVQSRITADQSKFRFPILYGMDEPTMQQLGLYISEPRSAQEADHRFPEPALFVVNKDGVLQLVDIANAPFLCPDLDRLVRGLGFIIDKGYPIRGTHR